MSLPRSTRAWHRPIAFGATLFIVIVGLAIGAAAYGATSKFGKVGIDLGVTRELAHRWLDTGSMYLPYQLAGPYPATGWPSLDVIPGLYPPSAIFLFLPFLWLPAVLWWALPIAFLSFVIARWRPAPWTWPILAAALLFPATWVMLWVGNSTIWIAAFIAGGLAYGAPGLLVLLKPSLAPFALAGARRRSWWIALAVWMCVALLMLQTWIDYLAAMRNLTADIGYSLASLPMAMVPIVAWAGRTATPRSTLLRRRMTAAVVSSDSIGRRTRNAVWP